MSEDTSPPKSQRNDLTEISRDAKTKVLTNFWLDRYSAIVNYSSKIGSSEGFWVDKKLTYSTNRGMFYVFISVVVSFYFLHSLLHHLSEVESSASHNILHVALFLAISILILLLIKLTKSLSYAVFAQRFRKASRAEFLRILSRREYQSVIGDQDVESDILEPQTEDRGRLERLVETRRFFFRRWIDLNFFSPFSYKFIWWWTLIAGVATAEMDYFTQTTGFGLAFMRAVIVSVIAYIATNIIRELLLLREHYVKGVDSAIEGNRAANQLTSTLSRFSAYEMPKLVDISRIAIRTTKIGEHLEKLITESTSKEYAGLHQQSVAFVDNVSRQIDNFVTQIKEGSDFVKRCVLLTLNRYLINETETLNTRQKHLITRFSTLAEIARELVVASYPGTSTVPREPNKNNIEFYALLAIPPVKFLNYDHKKYVGDPYWESYLEGLIISAKRGIPQKRFFVSLTADDRNDLQSIDNVPSQEAPDLFFEDIKDQLNKFVKVNKEGIPQHEPADAGVVDKRHYVVAGQPKGEGWKRLGDVLDNVYHVSGDCFVREFSRDEFVEILWDKSRKRPFDYFAIRDEGQWIFCLQTRYDKGLDVADIEVFYEGMSNQEMSEKWQGVKKNLDLVFFPISSRGVSPINAYGQ